MRAMWGFVPPWWTTMLLVVATACTPTAESQSSATNPSAWSSNDSDAEVRSPPKLPASDKPVRWEYADRLNTFRKAAPRTRSQHLGGEHEAEVLVNDAAATYPTGPLRQLPVGSVIVEALYVPSRPEVAAYFAMVKQPSATGGAWEFRIVSSLGMVERQDALTLCARCHAEAPHDHVFGRPR